MSYVQLAIEETAPPEGSNQSLTPYRVSTNVLYLPVTAARLGPGPQHIDRADEQRNVEGVVPRILDAFEPDGSIAERAYFNHLTYLLQLAGFTGAVTAGLGTAATTGLNNTTATGVNSLNSATINVGSTQGFPSAGQLTLAGGAAFAYTGVTPTSFTGCGSHAATAGGETIQDVIPTNTNKWVFSKRSGSAAKTAQLITAYTEQSVFLKGQGYGVSQVGLNAAGELTADLMGMIVKRIADPSLTPAYDSQSILPARRADMQLTWLAGSGDTDDFSISIANELVRRKTFGLTTRSYYSDKMYQGDAKVAITGSIPKYTLAAADVDALLAASTFSGIARWISDKNIGVTSMPYQARLDMPACQLVSGQFDEEGNKRRFGASYDFFAGYDEASGYDGKIQLINGVTAIETYV